MLKRVVPVGLEIIGIEPLKEVNESKEIQVTEPIWKKMSDEERIEYGIETLPSSLHEALIALENDKVITDALGTHVVEAYLRGKEDEWKDYHQQVTPWETEKYLNQL